MTVSNIQWHPSWQGAVEIEMKAMRTYLEYLHELGVTKAPVVLDTLIIKQDPDAPILNEMAEGFRTYNIFEYKSPGDGMSIDDLFKTLAYACLYKANAEHVNDIPFTELSVTMIREARPDEMFRLVKEGGGTVTQRRAGIFELGGIFPFPVQVVTTRLVDPSLHPTLRMLSKSARKEDVQAFLELMKTFTEPGDIRNAEAVLQASYTANEELFEKLYEEDPEMSKTLKDLMKKDFDETREEGRKEGIKEGLEEGRKEGIKEGLEEGRKEGIKEGLEEGRKETIVASARNVMNKFGVSAMEALEAVGAPQSDFAKYLAIL